MKYLFKGVFYSGIIIIILFEVLNVYFIMPMPGSQEIKSIDIAYFLYTSRWYFRIACAIMIAAGIISAFNNKNKLIPAFSLIAVIMIVYMFNFRMNAESMFKQPENLSLKSKAENMVGESSLVICVENNGIVKAYPIRFMSYHHQVQDTIGELPLIITYCNVCRTGRAFLPLVRGQHERFRLVGMDHYNAMFEDETTGSWWRQSTGESVAGPLKGQVLPETESMQLTVKKLFELYPDALVMQADKASFAEYDTLGKFEQGKSESRLTRTDSISWKDKSWVIGIEIGAKSKAYDWKSLKNQHIINDKIGTTPVVLVLSSDEQSFAAFERSSESEVFFIRNDTLYSNTGAYDFTGRGTTKPAESLKRVKAYQEFWHSWKTFHPDTEKYH